MKPDGAITRENLKGTSMEPTYGGALSFMRRKYTKDLSRADVAVSAVPFDLGASHRSGARMGPRSIRENSTNLCWGIVDHWDMDPFEILSVIDYGDCEFDPWHPETICGSIEKHISDILGMGVYAITLGGDHYITYPILKAYSKYYSDLCLVHFDAHGDTAESDPDAIYHGSMFYHAAKQKLISPENSIQVGIRTHSDTNLGYKVLKARDVHIRPIAQTIEDIRDRVGDRPVYFSFDIDCLDPAYAPGTGTPEVGGLSTWQVQEIMRGLDEMNLVGGDLVEVAPLYDPTHITGLAAANIVQDMLCIFASRMAIEL